MQGRAREVVRTLSDPDEIRRSRHDLEVMLFYLRSGARWVCVVIRRAEPMSRLITTYPADKMKEGGVLWKK